MWPTPCIDMDSEMVLVPDTREIEASMSLKFVLCLRTSQCQPDVSISRFTLLVSDT